MVNGQSCARVPHAAKYGGVVGWEMAKKPKLRFWLANKGADEEVLSYQEENAPDEFVIQEGPRIFDSDGKADNHDVDILGKPW